MLKVNIQPVRDMNTKPSTSGQWGARFPSIEQTAALSYKAKRCGEVDHFKN